MNDDKRQKRIEERCSKKEKKDTEFLKDVARKFYEEKDLRKKIKIVEDIKDDVLIYTFLNSEFIYDDDDNKEFFSILREAKRLKKKTYDLEEYYEFLKKYDIEEVYNINEWESNNRNDVELIVFRRIRDNVENKNEPPLLDEYLWYEKDHFDDHESGIDEYFELAKYYKEMWWTMKEKYE